MFKKSRIFTFALAFGLLGVNVVNAIELDEATRTIALDSSAT